MPYDAPKNLFSKSGSRRKSVKSKSTKGTASNPVSVIVKKRTNKNSLLSKIRPMPLHAFLKQRYSSDLKTITCTSGGWGYHQFAINNLYDVDYSGVGAQFMYFDTLASLYSYYRVMEYKMTVYSQNYSSDSPMVSMLLATPTVAGASDSQQLRECNLKKKIKYGGANLEILKNSIRLKPWQVLGVDKKTYLTDDIYKAAVNTAPEQVSYCTVYVQPFDEASTINVKCRVEIEVVARYEQSKIVARS